MQCFICGEQMQVVMVEPHVVDMQGFELRTFQCVGCGDTEKRPVFDSTRSPRAVLSKTVAAAPEPGAGSLAASLTASLTAPLSAPLPSTKMRTILGSLVRLRSSTPNP